MARIAARSGVPAGCADRCAARQPVTPTTTAVTNVTAMTERVRDMTLTPFCDFRAPGLSRLRLQPVDIAEDDTIRECADQCDRTDVDQRAHERPAQLKRDADDERRHDAGEV